MGKTYLITRVKGALKVMPEVSKVEGCCHEKISA